jgi:hypothetical protein
VGIARRAHRAPDQDVFIVTYACRMAGDFNPRVSHEHSEFCVCPLEDLAKINLPSGYRRSVECCGHIGAAKQV